MWKELIRFRWLVLASAVLLVGCDKIAVYVQSRLSQLSVKPTPQEHITPEERAAAAKLKPAKDAVTVAVDELQGRVHRAFKGGDFAELERIAADLLATKARFGNGGWKIVRYYDALCILSADKNDRQKEGEIFHAWMTAQPESVTAQTAYAKFLRDWAWDARGGGYADTVSDTGFKLFYQRLSQAHSVLDQARKLKQKTPMWWYEALDVALGEEWSKPKFDALFEEAKAFEPQFWGDDLTRAFSLLPRWYGRPGEWEAFAEKESQRSGGLGIETYARIVIFLRSYHHNIFHETKASWAKTKEGLEAMLKKYPDSLEVQSNAAIVAGTAGDRAYAQQMFAKIGDRYLPGVWRRPERFVHVKHWAETGEW